VRRLFILGLVPALGLLADCNLVIGAGRYEVGDGCRDCVQERCAAEAAACHANPGCTALSDCLAACTAGDVACRLACKHAHPAKDEATLALSACRSASCRDVCIGCGDAVDLGAVCDQCLQGNCCTELSACAADTSCARGGAAWTCFDPSCALKTASEPAVQAWLATPLAKSMFKCVVEKCTTECATGDYPWSCVGHYLHSGTAAGTVTVTIPVIEFGTSKGLDGVHVRACSGIDIDCATPIAVAAQPTAGGGVKQPSTTTITVPRGFAGYFELTRDPVEANIYAPTLFFPGYPINGPLNLCGGRQCELILTPSMPIVGLNQVSGLAQLLGLTMGGGGFLVPRVVDCQNNGGEGVSFGLDKPFDKTFYFVHGVPSASAEATDTTGLGALISVTPGFVTFTGKLRATGQLVTQYRLPVRANALTVLIAYPLNGL
jgi:hypothetical protein